MAGILATGLTLSYKTADDSYAELEGLQEMPEIGGTAEKVDVSVIKDGFKKYKKGIVDFGDLAFKFLFSNTGASDSFRVFSTLEASDGDTDFKIDLPDGTSFEFSGFVTSVKLGSAGVNGVLSFTATVAVNSEIEISNP
jgi:hypothetical protein